METIFECMMILCICAGLAWELLRFLSSGGQTAAKWERLPMITICIGFVVGIVWKAMEKPVRWIFALYVIGAMLSTIALYASSTRSHFFSRSIA